MNKRCDGCGAEAKYWVRLPSGKKLDFCGHHYREYQKATASNTPVREPSAK